MPRFAWATLEKSLSGGTVGTSRKAAGSSFSLNYQLSTFTDLIRLNYWTSYCCGSVNGVKVLLLSLHIFIQKYTIIRKMK